MCKTCDNGSSGSVFLDEIRDMLTEMGTEEDVTLPSPDQYVREDFRYSEDNAYLRATYVGDHIVITEVNPAYLSMATGLAIFLGEFDLVPPVYVTSVAYVGELSLGAFKDAKGWPETKYDEYSRTQTPEDPEEPTVEELDKQHESVVQRVKDGDIA